MFPYTGHGVRTPRFTPQGPRGSSSPASFPSVVRSGASVLSEQSDFLPFVPPHFVSFAWRYRVDACLFALTGGKRQSPGSRGLILPLAQCTGSSRGNGRISCVPGEPRCAYALFCDPGRTARVRSIRRGRAAPVLSTTKAPALGLSRLNHTALALAVYASPRELPHPTQDSLPAADQLYRTGSTRRAPSKGFRVASYISSSLPKHRSARTATYFAKRFAHILGLTPLPAANPA